MDHESIRDYCIDKDGCEESFPFDEETLVFKVYGKIFAILSQSCSKLLAYIVILRQTFQ